MFEEIKESGFMDVNTAIRSRRSIRAYDTRDVEEDKLRERLNDVNIFRSEINNLREQIMLGKKLKDFTLPDYRKIRYAAVKESVFSFLKLPGVDTILSPEMKSTGEVMGIDSSFEKAFFKAQVATYSHFPQAGGVLISIGRQQDKNKFAAIAKKFEKLGFTIYSTEGTAKVFEARGVSVERVKKISEGSNEIPAKIRSGEIKLVICTGLSRAGKDVGTIRRAAVENGVPQVTTFEAARASLAAIEQSRREVLQTKSLKEYYAMNKQ